MERKKNFDVMKWLRGVRDDNHKRLEHLSTEEFVHRLSEEGRNTKVWKERNKKESKRP